MKTQFCELCGDKIASIFQSRLGKLHDRELHNDEPPKKNL